MKVKLIRAHVRIESFSSKTNSFLAATGISYKRLPSWYLQNEEKAQRPFALHAKADSPVALVNYGEDGMICWQIFQSGCLRCEL